MTGGAKIISLRVERVFALFIAAGLIRAIYVLFATGSLPPPFFYDVRDTWMDWFNTAWFARDVGTYDLWKSIYPPISFVFMNMTGLSRCYEADALPARDCDFVGAIVLHGFYILNIFLICKTYLRIDRRTAVTRAFALSAGMPMLNALDRGNLVVVCFTCFLLAFGPLVRSARFRWVMLGCAINFKVYLIATVFPQLVKRRWRWVEGATLATVFVYLATYAVLGRGTVIQIFENIRDFSDALPAARFLDGWNAASYAPLIDILYGMNSPTILLIGSRNIEFWTSVLTAWVRLAQGMILLAFLATWFRPEVVPAFRIAALGTLLALITSEAGAYTIILFVFLVFMERWRGIGRPVALVTCFVLCLPFDLTLFSLGEVSSESFLAGGNRIVEYGITVAPFVRPGLVLVVAIALSCVTLRDVLADIRHDGLSNRWRFRHDLRLIDLPSTNGTGAPIRTRTVADG